MVRGRGVERRWSGWESRRSRDPERRQGRGDGGGYRSRAALPTGRWGLLAVALMAGLLAVATGPLQGLAGAASPARASAANPPFAATGYFHVAQGSDGRWWLVTPQGEPFYSAGIDHVSAAPDVDQVTGQCPYCETIAQEYPGGTEQWAKATVKQLRSWGFNSIGPFSDYSTFSSLMPYTVQLSMASGDDWFSPSFVQHADEVAQTQVAPLADDPNLIGYFTDSELTWGPDEDNTATLLDQYLALPADDPGHSVAESYVGDPNGFTTALAQRYFSVTTAAIRQYDPNHLILGVKAESNDVPPQVLEVASHYVNVFSIDDYQLLPGLAQAVPIAFPEYLPVQPNFANFEKYFKGPLMVAEYSFRAKTPLTPDTVPNVYPVYANQKARARAYTTYIGTVQQTAPWVVGDDWFEYVDEPEGGRTGDGENSNFGLVNVFNQPYQAMAGAVTLMHTADPEHTLVRGRQCDSWADGPTGVTCTTTAPTTPRPLSLLTRPVLTAATLQSSYHDTIVVAGGRPAYSFRISEGSLPRGITLDGSDGALTGKPKQTGDFHFKVAVADATTPATTVHRAYSMAVTVAPLKVVTSSLPAASTGTTYSASLVPAGGVGPYHWSLHGGQLPPGLDFHASPGRATVSGTPTTPGTYRFTVELKDSQRPSAEVDAHLTITVSTPT